MATAVKAIGGAAPTNGGEDDIIASAPYSVAFTLRGSAPFLFHRWNCEAVTEKANAAKGSKAKKSDNIESYVYRTHDGELAIPSEYVRQAVITAAKYRQDPRSPRKSAMDLFKAGVVMETDLMTLGSAAWDYLDTRRVVVQRAGVNRQRPAMNAGWEVSGQIMVLTPEYISRDVLLDVLMNAGRLVGVGDFRPTYGRFQVTTFDVL
jgi:hypothetical protein